MDYEARAERRFLDKVDKDGDLWAIESCWIWTGSRTTDGYGRFRYRGNPNCPGGTVLAHHFSFYLEHGRWPKEGMQLEHLCHNPRCVDPDHLREATPSENMIRKRENGTSSHVGKRKLTEADVIEIRQKYATGDYLQRELAAEYNADPSTISNVVTKKAWAHLRSGRTDGV